MEVRPVKGYEGRYGVTEDGQVWSYLTNKFLKPKIQKNGYQAVTLRRENEKQTLYVHRIVAEAFLPNPNNLPQVNHKDLNKKNNFVENLEWITAKGNSHHYWRMIKEAQK